MWPQGRPLKAIFGVSSLKFFGRQSNGPKSNLRATLEMAPHPFREWDTLRQRL